MNRDSRHGIAWIPLLIGLLVVSGICYPWVARTQLHATAARWLDTGDFEQANRELDRLLRIDQTDPHAWYLVAVLARRTNKIDQFQSALATAEALGYDDHRLNFQRRLLEVQLGQIDPPAEIALVELAAGFNSDELAAQTYEAIAQGYLRTFRLKEAWDCIEYWLKWRPQTITAHTMRGDICERTGRIELAIAENRQIVELAPQNLQFKSQLANSLLQFNEVDEAAQILHEVCSQAPDRAQYQLDLAEAELRLGNLESAESAVQKAFKLGVNAKQRAAANTLMGKLALVRGDAQQAVSHFLITIDLTPQDAVAHLSLGRALSLTGQSDLAKQHTERSEQIRSSYESVQAMTTQVIDHPQDPELRVKIGREMISLGMRPEGIGWIKTALLCDPNYQPAQQLLQSYASPEGSSNEPPSK